MYANVPYLKIKSRRIDKVFSNKNFKFYNLSSEMSSFINLQYFCLPL